MKYVLSIIAAASMLTACGNGSSLGNSGDGSSSANSAGSAGSFGLRKRSEEPIVPQLAQTIDKRAFIPFVKSAVLDSTKGGSILRVVGDTGVQGYHDIGLVQSDDSTPELLVFEFRATLPKPGQAANTERSKQVHAAVFVSDFTFPSAKGILIRAAQNTIILRR